ncbi:MAG: helix-turn-helix transcriptional regulator [Rhodocyclaceae bacterium]|jgi:ribosome-binding protein aMBF1 (putative translation factor)|nr:helix-turn-helix transcriptional regulator [Rhodocyclaceae bacterium]
MNLQKIKSANGKDEYVLLPVAVYEALKNEIQDELAHPKVKTGRDNEFVPFILEDYVDNPVALARMKAHLTQKQLAERMGVTQAYISKVERQDKVTPMLLERTIKATRHKS